MSHRNSKKSNRIGQSIQKHRAQRNSPYEAEAREAMDREYRSKLPNHPIPEPLAQPTPESITPLAPVTQPVTQAASKADPATAPVPPDAASELSTFNSELASASSSVLSPSPSASSSQISNFKSEIASSPVPSPSQLSTLNSQLASPPESSSSFETSNFNSQIPSSPSDFAAAKTYIASKPATKAMHKLQHILDNHDFDYLNPNDVAQLSALMIVYAQLQNSAAVERISESLDQVGAGYKREPLTRELTKVLSIQDRALARAQREKAAKERDQRRIEREAKREQAQAAKQARDERLFNQREDHLARKEKMVKDKLEIELTKRANRTREQVNKHSKSQTAKLSHPTTSSDPSTQDATLQTSIAEAKDPMLL